MHLTYMHLCFSEGGNLHKPKAEIRKQKNIKKDSEDIYPELRTLKSLRAKDQSSVQKQNPDLCQKMVSEMIPLY